MLRLKGMTSQSSWNFSALEQQGTYQALIEGEKAWWVGVEN